MFTTKTLEKTQHECVAERTKRKTDIGLVGIRGQAPNIEKIDPLSLIKDLADRVNSIETALICLYDKSLPQTPPIPPPSPFPLELLEHLKGGLKVKIDGGLQAINSHFQANQLSNTIKSLVNKIQELPKQPLELVQPITVNAPEPNIQNLIEVRVPDTIPPIINNYIPDSHPIINNYLPESSTLITLIEILRTLTSLEQRRASQPIFLSLCSTVQQLYQPPKKMSTTESYCQAQPKTKESYSQTFGLQKVNQKSFKIMLKPLIRNYVSTTPPNVLVKPAAQKLHIHPRFIIKKSKKVKAAEKPQAIKKTVKDTIYEEKKDERFEQRAKRIQYVQKKIQYTQKATVNPDDKAIQSALKKPTKVFPNAKRTKQLKKSKDNCILAQKEQKQERKQLELWSAKQLI